MKKYLSHFKSDLPAGLVVFLVAIPLCLGIAAVSGVPAFSGLIAGIIGGIVVASLSGSQLGVSGPAAGLAVIVFTAIDEFRTTVDQSLSATEITAEALQMFFMAVVIAGALQLIAGFLKGGIIGYYFPSAVIKGMLAGIGLTILLKEIPHAFGYDKNVEGDFSFFQIDGENTFTEIVNAVGNPDVTASLIALVGLAILFAWEQPFIKRFKFSSIIQGPLVAIVVGIAIVAGFASSSVALGEEHLVSVPIAGNVSEFLGFFSFPNFASITKPLVWKTAGVIAIVASLETLLCLEATDKLDPEKKVSPTNQELKAQGIGNMLSGLVGGLPITQVIVRSSANIQSGGKTKMSAIYHGFFILLFIAFLPMVLNLIPRASLAAILIVVGIKLAKPSSFKAMYDQGLSQFLPFIVTILFIIFKDLLWGVGIGLIVAVFEILYLNYKKPYIVDVDPAEHRFIFRLKEDITFLHKASIQDTLNNIPNGRQVVIDLRETKTMHPDVAEIIKDFKTHAEFTDIDVRVKGLADQSQRHADEGFKKLIDEVIDVI